MSEINPARLRRLAARIEAGEAPETLLELVEEVEADCAAFTDEHGWVTVPRLER